MGLAERRAIKHFSENEYPKLKEEIERAAAFSVPLEIDWESLAMGAEGYSQNYSEDFPKLYFRPLIEAIKGVCVDELGKEALKEKLKKVQIGNHGPTFEATFHLGVLKIECAYSNIDYWQERKNEIQKVLEKNL